ncbi:hypothetical protein EZV62_021807 [Acer yangbiense]|uniref:Uncharacterized protein n=1 Tax=Acer yangbiense TaxID=1000413 RepID=A0A5C7H6G3_9ROSI|nr:hypothetical protein EZV62_021807 [Acer yangbiense]
MEDQIRSSPQLATSSATATRKKQDMSAMSRVKRNCLFFTASLKEGFGFIKAFFTGLGKKVTAKNEQEATEGDLQTAKMQVEAVDEAEETKKRLDKSM